MAPDVRNTPRQLIGRWRIVDMDGWDREDIDLIEPAFIEFTPNGMGEFGFIAVRGAMDCRPFEREGRPGVEFTWDGFDECDPASGRGWAVLIDDATVEGHVFLHLSEDSSFRAEPFTGD